MEIRIRTIYIWMHMLRYISKGTVALTTALIIGGCSSTAQTSKKVKNAARNFSTISKMALSILKNDKTTKGSLNLKRLKAGWDEEYLSKLLKGSAI